jgi:hypothetical protein
MLQGLEAVYIESGGKCLFWTHAYKVTIFFYLIQAILFIIYIFFFNYFLIFF